MSATQIVTMVIPIVVAVVSGGFAYLQARKIADRNASMESRKIDLSQYESLNRALRGEIDSLRADRVEDWAAHREAIERVMDQLHDLEIRCKTENLKVRELEDKIDQLTGWVRNTWAIIRDPDVARLLATKSVTIPPPPLDLR